MSVLLTDVLPPWVQRINANKRSPNEVSKLFFYLMKELHLSYSDIMGMPVPAILSLSEELAEFAREQERQMKRANRK